MSRLFAMDGKLNHFMGQIADLVLLNLLWLIFCIPIVTIGASTTALQYVVLRMARNEESYIFASFFQAFKDNLKQSTIIWGILLLISSILYFDFYFSSHIQVASARIMFIPFALIAFLTVITANYIFPILAYFKNSTKKVFKNSLLMSLAHLPYTLLITAVSLLPVFLLLIGDLVIAMFINVIIGIAFSAWINAHIFRKLFDRYMV
ncbi:YesL family protein [Cellulosilyticum sp. I15G10I2]|uniref:YesL family protein n=1 Tax=Cellulosilyticum sp. I15G10I2 TaxID=1892843 RepID=UPI00085C1629|nr:YesL family protein [Cellulosilyticum sp. I15G10I2]